MESSGFSYGCESSLINYITTVLEATHCLIYI